MFLCTALGPANALLFIISPRDISLEANVLSAEENCTDGVVCSQSNCCVRGFLLGSWQTRVPWPVGTRPQASVCTAYLARRLRFCPQRVHISVMTLTLFLCLWLPPPSLLRCHAGSGHCPLPGQARITVTSSPAAPNVRGPPVLGSSLLPREVLLFPCSVRASC